MKENAVRSVCSVCQGTISARVDGDVDGDRQHEAGRAEVKSEETTKGSLAPPRRYLC